MQGTGRLPLHMRKKVVAAVSSGPFRIALPTDKNRFMLDMKVPISRRIPRRISFGIKELLLSDFSAIRFAPADRSAPLPLLVLGGLRATSISFKFQAQLVYSPWFQQYRDINLRTLMTTTRAGTQDDWKIEEKRSRRGRPGPPKDRACRNEAGHLLRGLVERRDPLPGS